MWWDFIANVFPVWAPEVTCIPSLQPKQVALFYVHMIYRLVFENGFGLCVTWHPPVARMWAISKCALYELHGGIVQLPYCLFLVLMLYCCFQLQGNVFMFNRVSRWSDTQAFAKMGLIIALPRCWSLLLWNYSDLSHATCTLEPHHIPAPLDHCCCPHLLQSWAGI